jgi:hypothetical protein
MKEIITLTSDEMSKLFRGDDEHHYIDADTDDGSFDSEKGAMYDFPITLYRNGKEYEATGGYYTGQTGVIFDDTLDFEEVVKKVKAPKEDKSVTVKIMYDDSPDQVADRVISQIQSIFPRLVVERLEGGDGFEEYKIIKQKK